LAAAALVAGGSGLVAPHAWASTPAPVALTRTIVTGPGATAAVPHHGGRVTEDLSDVGSVITAVPDGQLAALRAEAGLSVPTNGPGSLEHLGASWSHDDQACSIGRPMGTPAEEDSDAARPGPASGPGPGSDSGTS
jgi:hypothetical protein